MTQRSEPARNRPDAGARHTAVIWHDVAMVPRLVGVYNANGTLWGELAYVVGRLRGTAHCALCDVTHGRMRRRPDFDRACQLLPMPLELKHRNEIDGSLDAVIDGRYPCVLIVDPEPRVLMGPDDIDACAGDPDALVARITELLADTS